MTWNRFPGEIVNSKNSISVDWQGAGWYASARNFPGSSLYTLSKVPEDWLANYANPTAAQLDDMVKSFGHGTLRWLDTRPV